MYTSYRQSKSQHGRPWPTGPSKARYTDAFHEMEWNAFKYHITQLTHCESVV